MARSTFSAWFNHHTSIYRWKNQTVVSANWLASVATVKTNNEAKSDVQVNKLLPDHLEMYILIQKPIWASIYTSFCWLGSVAEDSIKVLAIFILLMQMGKKYCSRIFVFLFWLVRFLYILCLVRAIECPSHSLWHGCRRNARIRCVLSVAMPLLERPASCGAIELAHRMHKTSYDLTLCSFHERTKCYEFSTYEDVASQLLIFLPGQTRLLNAPDGYKSSGILTIFLWRPKYKRGRWLNDCWSI